MDSERKRRVTVLVSNDLVFDQRVRKSCNVLLDMGLDVLLVGRRTADSPPLERPYATRRFRLPFASGALFYAALNVRLFAFLLAVRTDIIHANDLDTLPAAWLAARLRRKTVVYDSHEFFTEAAGLTGRSFQRNVWLRIERWIFPRLKHVLTVNETIADAYRERYGVPVHVLRNVPPRRTALPAATRTDLGLPEEGSLVILQGAFLDKDRGVWEAAQAMQFLDGVHLLLIGRGEEWDRVKQWLEQEQPNVSIIQKPRLPFEELQQYTALADLGLSLDKPDHLNYRYSLPNKLFDYIQMQTPVLTSELPELMRVHREFAIGGTISHHGPRHIAERIQSTLSDPAYPSWKSNLKRAAEAFHWGAESEVLREVYNEALSER